MFVRALLLSLLFAAPAFAQPALEPANWSDVQLRDEDQGKWGSLRTAIARSLTYYGRRPANATLRFGERTVTTKQMRAALKEVDAFLASGPNPHAFEQWLEARFDLYQSVVGKEVLFTGYYEPVIEASLTRRPGYEVPIYGVPKDLVKVDLGSFGGKGKASGRLGKDGVVRGPYWTRRQLWVENKLAGEGYELAWAKSHVDAFFVEVQGSGSLRLPDGTLKRFGYAGSNGHGYRSIGKLLVNEGKASRQEMSMQWLRKYLSTCGREEMMRVLCHNESVVFFRWLPGEPEGALGQPVTPGRSIATDLRLFPRGALGFVDTSRVVRRPGKEDSYTSLRRFVLNQDTGGAIRGPGRVDIFFGRSEQAAYVAGKMKFNGRLFFLVPKAERKRPKLY